MNYSNTKENYDKQIEKLTSRLAKQKKQHAEVLQIQSTLQTEVE